MAMAEFFDLRTPEHLLRKLEREYERWQADPVNSDFAWNFFVTAEHLPDWIYHQEMSTTQRVRPDLLGLPHGEPRDFRLSHPLTRLCSHLANGGKHFYIQDRRIKKVVQRAVRELTGYVEDDYIEDGYYAEEPELRIYLAPQEVPALQQAGVPVPAADIKALWLAAQVLEFWRQFPAFQTPSEAGAPCPPAEEEGRCP